LELGLPVVEETELEEDVTAEGLEDEVFTAAEGEEAEEVEEEGLLEALP